MHGVKERGPVLQFLPAKERRETTGYEPLAQERERERGR